MLTQAVYVGGSPLTSEELTMKFVMGALVVIVMLGVGVSSAQAQAVTFEGCFVQTHDGPVPVASVRNDNLQDVAQATYQQLPNRTVIPIIVYNPRVLQWLQPATRIFFYAHECAHHVLNHMGRGFPLGHEQEADCWSIVALVSNGILGDDDITAVQRDLAKAGKGDWTHLPGPQRAINLRRCFNR